MKKFGTNLPLNRVCCALEELLHALKSTQIFPEHVYDILNPIHLHCTVLWCVFFPRCIRFIRMSTCHLPQCSSYSWLPRHLLVSSPLCQVSSFGCAATLLQHFAPLAGPLCPLVCAGPSGFKGQCAPLICSPSNSSTGIYLKGHFSLDPASSLVVYLAYSVSDIDLGYFWLFVYCLRCPDLQEGYLP